MLIKPNVKPHGFDEKKRFAIDSITHLYAIASNPFIAFSAGKDSSAVMQLALECLPSFKARMLTGGESRLLFPELDGIFSYWSKNENIDFEEVHIDHVFTNEWQGKSFWEQYDSFKGEWDKYFHSPQYNGLVLGLRRQESKARAIALQRRVDGCKFPIYQYSDRTKKNYLWYRLAPIAYWTDKDVEYYLRDNNIPVLHIYERLGYSARTHTRIGRTSLANNQINYLREFNPKNYQLLINRFPELSRYV